jgi:DNA-binding response OmpR family regulator
MRILYVENHAELARTVVEAFLVQHEVWIVPSVADAIAAAGSGLFDVALVDFDLDDGKGDGFVRWLRAMTIPLPVVAVSAHDRGNEALVRAGANTTCKKLELSRLPQVLDALVGHLRDLRR